MSGPPDPAYIEFTDTKVGHVHWPWLCLECGGLAVDSEPCSCGYPSDDFPVCSCGPVSGEVLLVSLEPDGLIHVVDGEVKQKW